MFGTPVPSGAVFHAESKRRRQVEFTPELRQLTANTVAALHALSPPHGTPGALAANVPQLPAVVYKPACKECSLYAVCLPELAGNSDRITRASAALFKT